ncbi:hypothetical protein, partial [Pseudomonas aeruginosa]|uniref:hypothetical protein n=1 Tax=Pseudomonas aeruginosa TaxID=287 RepID=UPI002F956AC7
ERLTFLREYACRSKRCFSNLRLLTHIAEGDFQTIHPSAQPAPDQQIDCLLLRESIFREGR